MMILNHNLLFSRSNTQGSSGLFGRSRQEFGVSGRRMRFWLRKETPPTIYRQFTQPELSKIPVISGAPIWLCYTETTGSQLNPLGGVS